MPVWYEQTNVAHRLSHPFVYPGGPSVVAEPIAARRQSVQQFQDQATAAWADLLTTVNEGLQQQQQVQQGGDQISQEQQDIQQQQHHQQQQNQKQQQQHAGLDLAGLAVPLLPRKRLTGPVMLVPQPDAASGMTADQATAAAVAAVAQCPETSNLQGLETLIVPVGCLKLHSWVESAAAEEPPGEVVADFAARPGVTAGAGAAARAAMAHRGSVGAAAAGAAGGDSLDVLQPGSEVVVSLAVMDTSKIQSVVQQEIQALGSNTLAQVRDIICCPTDKLAEGLGTHNPAAYFYIDGRFYDDTRTAPAAECSQQVEQWAQRLGLAGPRHLLQPPFEPPEENDAVGAAAAGAGAGAAATTRQQEQPSPAASAGAVVVREDGGNAQLEQQQQGQQQQQQDSRPSRDMQHVRLSELVLQASNRPMALFSHQGLCEHAVVITDVRLLHVADPNRRSAYPRAVFTAPLGRRLHCGICKRLGATTLLLEHPETPEAVIVLCMLCSGLFDVSQHPGARKINLDPLAGA